MKRGERGLTLLEMIVATLVMGVAVVGLLSAITTSMRNASRVTDYDRAVQLARGKLDELLLDSQIPLNAVLNGAFDPALTGGLEAGWRARLTPFLLPPDVAAGQLTMDRLEIEVWWMSGGQRRTFLLDGYRTRALTAEDVATQEAPK